MNIIIHRCKASDEMWARSSKSNMAVSECYETEDGEMWADDGEYANVVNYCPFCGKKAGKQFPVNKALET